MGLATAIHVSFLLRHLHPSACLSCFLLGFQELAAQGEGRLMEVIEAGGTERAKLVRQPSDVSTAASDKVKQTLPCRIEPKLPLPLPLLLLLSIPIPIPLPLLFCYCDRYR